jgi:hypothetical protein
LLEGALKRLVEALLRERRRGCRRDQTDRERGLEFRPSKYRHIVLPFLFAMHAFV